MRPSYNQRKKLTERALEDGTLVSTYDDGSVQWYYGPGQFSTLYPEGDWAHCCCPYIPKFVE